MARNNVTRRLLVKGRDCQVQIRGLRGAKWLTARIVSETPLKAVVTEPDKVFEGAVVKLADARIKARR